MRRVAVVGAAALALMALSAPAFAKGPTKATIEGEGLRAPITLDGSGEPVSGTMLSHLTESSGVLDAFNQTGRLMSEVPKGDLGLQFVITWYFPDPVIQEVYPYAEGGPLAYTESGQTLYGNDLGGGWHRAGPAQRDVLVEVGIPEPPVSSSGPLPAGLLAALAMAALA
ncbi:MAG: hypothetical protein ACRDXD_15050, partial [Acidimicrobiia bacterium]